MKDGTILRQAFGIPMWDPLSPGITITTCAWMEKLYLETIDEETKQYFSAKRYMDDILMFYAKTNKWNFEKFIQDFEKSDCYWSPLKLEEGDPNTFLESTFSIENNAIRFKIKNANESERKVWRYHEYDSYCHYKQKRATLMACLKKVQRLASDNEMLKTSAIAKLQEFKDRGYPRSIRTYVCAVLARDTGNTTWFRVRDVQ